MNIRYNHLNKPTEITFEDGNRQTITYDGFGNKKRVDYAVGPATVIGGDIPADDSFTVTSSRVYSGKHIFTDGELEYSGFSGGYFGKDASPNYYINDWQGNVAVVLNNNDGVIQTNCYYPYGEPTLEPSGQPFLFGGKERDHASGRNTYDFGARQLLPYGQWSTPDSKSETFYPFSPFSYCGGDPINRVDRDGREWYKTMEIDRYDVETEQFVFKEAIRYTSCKDINTFNKENTDPNAIYMGRIVVVFDGSYQERLASNGTIDGEGAINAQVTVYGPNGSNDIENYIGFTMTSDYSVFGAIDNGIYDVNYDVKGKSGTLKSHYAVNHRGPVDCLNGINPSPEEYEPCSPTQKNGIFVHPTNFDGTARHNPITKKAVSTGCILILGKQWQRFENQIGKSGFKMIINRK